MLSRSRRSSTSSISLQELSSHSSYPNLRPPRSQGQNGDRNSVVSESPIEGPRRQPTDASTGSQQEKRGWHRIVSGLSNFWASNVSCEVDYSGCRDHLALERTFLGYLRTSMTLAMIGTTVAQLFSISHHDAGFGYTAVGRPLAAACFAVAIGTLLMGAVRTWRIQNAIIRGRALASGFEIHLIGISVSILLLVFLGFLLTIDLLKTNFPESRPDG